MTTEGNIIIFQHFYDPMLAHIIRTRLEDAGIPCFVSDENTIVAQPFYNQAIGGIKLNIFEHDLQRANAVLAENSDLPTDAPKAD